MGPQLKFKIGFIALVVFYVFAGMNHFINSDFYLPLIPDYFIYKSAINCVSGTLEVLLGLGLLYVPTRKYMVIGIILMLIAFIPSHWHFIKVGACLDHSICVPIWIAWVRLIVIHPLLILWAWKYRNFKWKA